MHLRISHKSPHHRRITQHSRVMLMLLAVLHKLFLQILVLSYRKSSQQQAVTLVTQRENLMSLSMELKSVQKEHRNMLGCNLT